MTGMKRRAFLAGRRRVMAMLAASALLERRCVRAAVKMAAATLLSGVGAVPLAAQPAQAAPRPASVEDRMAGFLAAVQRGPLDSLSSYFPRSGDFTYERQSHERQGARRGVWRFPASAAHQAITRGPLLDILTINVEAQPVGAFAHQLMHRGSRWRRVRGTRFVPADAAESSALYVQWRREDGEWVISSIGDESFGEGVPLPSWCC